VARFHHVGVPTKAKQPKETYLEGGKVYITNPDASPYQFEFLRFEKESPLPKELQTGPHVAYKVDDIAAAMKGEKVLVPPFDPMPGLRVAFIVRDGVPVELMQDL